MKISFVLFLMAWGSGCATARQTNALLEAPRNIPEASAVHDVPFIEQAQNFCGPASLTMALQWAGKDISVDEIGKETYTPGKGGTLQADLIGAARRNGMLAIPIQGIPNLLTEISAGHPVVVLQNLAFSWYPKWHYAVVIGYDLDRVELTLHSGPEAFRKVDLRKFEKSWAPADYWGMVVLPPGKLTATGDDLAHAATAAAFEALEKPETAELVYRSIQARWPGSLSALIGLGNTRYAAKDYRGAIRFLREATRIHPRSAVAWHNLATAEGQAGWVGAARKSAQEALKTAPDSATAQTYRESLKAWL